MRCQPPVTTAQDCPRLGNGCSKDSRDVFFELSGRTFLPPPLSSCFTFQSFHICHNTVKINQQKPHLNGVGRREERTLSSHSARLLTSPGRDKPCIPSRKCHHDLSSNSSARGRLPDSASGVTTRIFHFLQWTPRLYRPPSPPSAQSSVPLLFHRTCTWFAIRSHVPNCNSLLLRNKPTLLEKYLAIC